MFQRVSLFLATIFVLGACVADAASNGPPKSFVNTMQAPAFYPDEPACKVKSIQKLAATFENIVPSPTSNLIAFTQLDSNNVYQVYVGPNGGRTFTCISCVDHPSGPKANRNKPLISWHPSGQWLVVGVEKDSHDLEWAPNSWQSGLLQSGVWLNMWLTTPSGDRWYQITDFKKTNGPSDGFIGDSFTPDGRKAVWAEIVDGNVFANAFGIWKLYVADFYVDPNNVPSLVNKRDITPAGAKWVEPGNFSPDGRRILLSSDIGMSNARGQDQFALDIVTGAIQNLTNSPTVWDEHGLYSPDGRKISFMSSYPYRDNPDSYKTTSLQTEFMLMDSDGSHLQQLTHFNVPGYPESQPEHTIAAVAGFLPDGSQLFGTVMGPNFTKTNWTITFEGRCGNQGR